MTSKEKVRWPGKRFSKEPEQYCNGSVLRPAAWEGDLFRRAAALHAVRSKQIVNFGTHSRRMISQDAFGKAPPLASCGCCCSFRC